LSDNSVEFLPVDPHFVPDAAAAERAAAILRAAAPRADEVSSEVEPCVVFRDCGANFEQVRCPRCGKEIDTGCWQDWMDQDFVEGGFQLQIFATPCCGHQATLDQLTYEMPQGFSRYTLRVRNPGAVVVGVVPELEHCLGCRLRVIRAHY
jgi:hypothetical protein